jgi:hypothetical protein
MMKVTDSVVECLICGEIKYIAAQRYLLRKEEYADRLKEIHSKKRLPKVRILGRPSLVEYWWEKNTKYYIRINKLADCVA